MILTEFRPWHATVLGPRDATIGPELMAQANLALAGGPALTLLNKEKHIIACFGIVIVMKHTAECWALMGDDAKKHAKTIHKAAKWCAEEAHKRYGVKRLQAAISDQRPTAMRWAQRLGFQPESYMPKFGHDGETFIRFVRFF